MASASSFCGRGGAGDIHQGFLDKSTGRCVVPGGIGAPLSRLSIARGSGEIKPQALGRAGCIPIWDEAGVESSNHWLSGRQTSLGERAPSPPPSPPAMVDPQRRTLPGVTRCLRPKNIREKSVGVMWDA